jgi:hypothetical protein
VAQEERHHLLGHPFGGADQVALALVLAVAVVGDEHHATPAEARDAFLDRLVPLRGHTAPPASVMAVRAKSVTQSRCRRTRTLASSTSRAR